MAANVVQANITTANAWSVLRTAPSGFEESGVLTILNVSGLSQRTIRIAKTFNSTATPGLANIIKFDETVGWMQIGGILLPPTWSLQIYASDINVAFTFDFYSDVVT